MKNILVLFTILNPFLFGYAQTGKDSMQVTKTYATDDYSNFRTDKQASPMVKPYIEVQKKDSALDYDGVTKVADSFFVLKKFELAKQLYELAIAGNNCMGKVRHRYNLACCLTQLNDYDGAFVQLTRLTSKGKYAAYYQITEDKYLLPLQKDKRWKSIIDTVKQNVKENEQNLINLYPVNPDDIRQ